jgi:hypothetical protein
MAQPNLVNTTTIYGRTTGANLTSITATTVLNNPASSSKCLKINTVNACNYTANAASITVGYYNGANVTGTQFQIVGVVSVPANSTLNIIDKSSQYYLEENTSLGATAGTANAIIVTCSYEDIS